MTGPFENRPVEERVLLIGIGTGEGDDVESSLAELAQLVETAGAVTVGQVVQNRESVHPATYLGKGKLEEVKWQIWETEATGVVCDDELSPAQLRNLEKALEWMEKAGRQTYTEFYPREIARLREALEKQGTADNTVVSFSGMSF